MSDHNKLETAEAHNGQLTGHIELHQHKTGQFSKRTIDWESVWRSYATVWPLPTKKQKDLIQRLVEEQI